MQGTRREENRASRKKGGSSESKKKQKVQASSRAAGGSNLSAQKKTYGLSTKKEVQKTKRVKNNVIRGGDLASEDKSPENSGNIEKETGGTSEGARKLRPCGAILGSEVGQERR